MHPFPIDACCLCARSTAVLCGATVQYFAAQPVAGILNQHFWFELDYNSGVFVCQPCWLRVNDFHQFYESVRGVYDTLSLHAKAELASGGGAEEADVKPLPAVIKSENGDDDGEDAGEEAPFGNDNDRCSSGSSDSDVEQAERKVKPKSRARQSINESGTSVTSGAGTPAKRRGRPPKSESGAVAKKPRKPKAEGPAKPKLSKKDRDERKDLEDELMRQYIDMRCGECGDTFHTFDDLRQHFIDEHRRLDYYVDCCGKRFTKRNRALAHCRWHVNPKQFECPHCLRQFTTRLAQKEHIGRDHADPNAPLHPCQQCTNVYKLYSKLRHHVRIVHTPEEDRRFECYQCHKRFVMLSTLKNHLETSHAPADYARFVCDVCARQFKLKSNYEQHYAVQHGGAATKRQCPECGKWLKHQFALSRHIHVQHRLPPVECPECKRMLPNNKALSAHRRTVHTAPKYGCTVCGKMFKKPEVLREHLAMHAGISDLYGCAYCDRTFRSQANMYKHRRQVHAEQAAEDKERRRCEENEANAVEQAEAERMEVAKLVAEREESRRMAEELRMKLGGAGGGGGEMANWCSPAH